MAIQLTNALLRDIIEGKGWGRPEDGKLHLCGIRGCVPLTDTVVTRQQNIPNSYNDTMLVFGSALCAFKATTDPGATFTKNPTNPKGCAHLCPGKWIYKHGLHKGKPALVQAGPVTVRRDRDRDAIAEPSEPLDTGWFGINHHAGGMAPTVGAWSAGCQVVWGGWAGEPWICYLNYCKQFRQSTYNYYLLLGSDFEPYLPRDAGEAEAELMTEGDEIPPADGNEDEVEEAVLPFLLE